MNYKLAITGNLRDLKAIRALSAENRKSQELWDLFEKSTSLVEEDKFIMPHRQVDFITLIRSLYSNKIITFGNNTMCTVRTCEPLQSRDMSLNDICITNAFKAYTQSFQVLNPGKQNALLNSQPQVMGVINYHNRLSVYLNVIVEDRVFDLLDIKDATLCHGAQLVPIPLFTPVKGSREELITDSLVIVKEEPPHA